MRIGIAADHGGFELKAKLTSALKAAGHDVVDFGAHELVVGDDYPDFVVPLARAVATGEVTRGVAICGSGVGACVVANKLPGVRAALITESFSAHQGVEDDDMNVMCLGGQVTGEAQSWDLVQTFLRAEFKGDERFGAGSQKWRRWKERRGPNSGKSFPNAPRSSSPSGQSDRVRADDIGWRCLGTPFDSPSALPLWPGSVVGPIQTSHSVLRIHTCCSRRSREGWMAHFLSCAVWTSRTRPCSHCPGCLRGPSLSRWCVQCIWPSSSLVRPWSTANTFRQSRVGTLRSRPVLCWGLSDRPMGLAWHCPRRSAACNRTRACRGLACRPIPLPTRRWCKPCPVAWPPSSRISSPRVVLSLPGPRLHRFSSRATALPWKSSRASGGWARARLAWSRSTMARALNVRSSPTCARTDMS